MKGRTLILAAVVVAVAQIGFLVSAIYSRAALLRTGQEVTLETRPVDPRDLLRGDYVALSYDISRIPVALVRTERARDGKAVGTVYVRLRTGEGTAPARAIAVGFGEPLADVPGVGEVDIRGTSTSYWTGDATELFVDYGLERFYLPEGEGRAVEKDLAQRNFFMRVAIGEDGAAQIKSFHDGETPIYSEPLY